MCRLRAATGSGRFTYSAGLRNGRPLYDRATIRLEPNRRDLEGTITHEAPVGREPVGVACSSGFRYKPGAGNWRIGAVYRLRLQEEA